MDKVVIGLVGKQGSGKNTFVEYLKKELPNKRIEQVRSGSGGVLDAFLNIAGVPVVRENQQKMAKGLREYFGDDFISEAVGSKIRKTNADIVFFDAVRWRSDESVVRKFSKHILVFIHADKDIRFERLVNRLRGDEKELTREQFEKAELASTEVEIDSISLSADFSIVNNESIDALVSDVKFFIDKFGLSK